MDIVLKQILASKVDPKIFSSNFFHPFFFIKIFFHPIFFSSKHFFIKIFFHQHFFLIQFVFLKLFSSKNSSTKMSSNFFHLNFIFPLNVIFSKKMLSSKFASSNFKKIVNKLEHAYKEVYFKPQQELSLAQLSPSF